MRRHRVLSGVSAALALTVLVGCSPETVPVAHGPGGEAPNGRSYPASISDDGRYVAYPSDASNLVPDDTNGVTDVFVLDRRTGHTSRVDVSSTGEQANGPATTLERLSGNGRSITFVSNASNLVPGDTNGTEDVFVHDLRSGRTERVSVSTDGHQSSGIGPRGSVLSDNGRLVAFAALGLEATDPSGLGVYLHDRRSGRTYPVPGPPLPDSAVLGTMSGDGHTLVYLILSPEGTGVVPIVRNLRTGVDDMLLAGHPFASEYSIDVDDAGRTIVWSGRAADGSATGLLADLRSGEVEVLAHSSGSHAVMTVSGTGRYVATFTATDPPDRRGAAIAVLDRRHRTTRSVGAGYWTDLSNDGRAVVYETLDQSGPFLWTARR